MTYLMTSAATIGTHVQDLVANGILPALSSPSFKITQFLPDLGNWF